MSVSMNGSDSAAGIPLSAADIIEAAKKANGNNVQGGKIRINSKAAANGQAKAESKQQPGGGGNTPGQGGKHKAKDNAKGPNAKKQKVSKRSMLCSLFSQTLVYAFKRIIPLLPFIYSPLR